MPVRWAYRITTLFLSTPSARRATFTPPRLQVVTGISIHALREEGDSITLRFVSIAQHFYPRPPRGGRHLPQPSCCCTMVFLSTPSARRATSAPITLSPRPSNFYPRPPRGGRPITLRFVSIAQHFYPRPPRGGRLMVQRPACALANFYPRPPRGGRPMMGAAYTADRYFYPRPPRGGRLRSWQP